MAKRAARAKKTMVPDVPETMPQAAERPSADHNKPPQRVVVPAPALDLTPEQWGEWMDHIFEGVTQRAQDLLGSFQRFLDGYPLRESTEAGAAPIGIEKWSDDVHGRAGDLRTKIADVIKQAEHLHGIEKAPILQAARAVDGYKNAFLAKLVETDSRGKLIPGSSKPVNVIVQRQTIYARYIEARSRKAAEEDAARLKKAADETAAAAARTMDHRALEETGSAFARAAEAEDYAKAKPAEHSRVHGPGGSVTSLRENWQFIEGESDIVALAKAVVADTLESIELVMQVTHELEEAGVKEADADNLARVMLTTLRKVWTKDGTAQRTYLAFNTSRIGIAVRSEKVRAIPGCVIRDEKRL